MSLVELNRDPQPRQLKQFGVIAALALPAIGWFWSGGSSTVLACCGGVGFLLAAVGMVRPIALKPLFVGLSLVTLPIGIVMSELMLVLLFCCVFAPVGLAFRLMGRDALLLRPQQAGTHWQPKSQPQGTADYFRQWSR